MSIARVKSVTKAQKDQGQCDKCGTMLPKGSAYRWFKVGFRSRHKHVRCMEAKCTPRSSELESSQLADAYAAQEAAHDTIDAADCIEDIKGALTDCASAAEECASAYEDSINNAPMLEDQLRDKVDALESWSSEMEQADMQEEEDAHCDDHEKLDNDCDGCQVKAAELLDEAKDAARTAVDSLEA